MTRTSCAHVYTGSQSATHSACHMSFVSEARSNAPAWSTAAVAGAIAGVYYGFGAIPPKWVGRLRGKAVIDQCI